ncbi:putative F-box domain, galactose oxidase/kelch, beta-propeller, F-box associated interaction [Medicago truncatula]|uniref:F-box protein interaction domain protein n=1 Tax=Medicago truncatula TaxID=3880 RepID=A0A072V4K6_MEDTR|nr:F-box/kelch-repeat protein At3g23880 [Medicago truncatula]XP_039687215.1 F-box/kelch-repeat protein At3g23880 [Medicago truncatula]KEH33120.1 F-box protein interaction domain protein [Medicago truncatula]RHN66038.1 putative F-box domain, galactose oxidase/kelch, beta-propeller, F-box associated interaction [Medicago truncatula]
MALGNDEDDPTANRRQRLIAGTLTFQPRPELPTLPFDVLPEILCRLPVKLLIQLRCLCKFFNSLISDPTFAKKHLQLSTKRHHLVLTNDELVMYDSPIPSLFSTSAVFTQTQLHISSTLTNGRIYAPTCSCDGIFLGMLKVGSYYLWNPSIRKFKLLPTLENPHEHGANFCSFGYDHLIDNYKVIVVSSKNKVSVNTLGTDYWTRIEDIPYSDNICGQGVFVNGTVNWLASDDSNILSLDLNKESYQHLLLPDSENDLWILHVVRDCLGLFGTGDMSLDVWIMKDYGNKESWTKLYSVPNMQDRGLEAYDALYISEDDQLLVDCIEIESGNDKLVLYDSKTGTLNIPEFQNNYERICPNVYIESLISP